MMLALAVLDLPFAPGASKHATKTENGAFTLTAGGPVIAYFPAATRAGAAFAHYPVRGGRIAGVGKPMAICVVRQLTQFDKGSWDHVSQHDSEEDVFAFLREHSLRRIELARVAWRARQSADFFRRLVELLKQRHRFDPTIYSYAIMHNDTPALREWLRHRADFTAAPGPWLDSTLIRIDPIERRAYQHLEHSPQVNPRAETQQAALAATEPSFDFKVENRKVTLTWQNLAEVTVNYYRLDPGFAFSASPFVSEDASRFAIVKPGRSEVKPLPGGRDTIEFSLPEEYTRANVLGEIIGAGRRKAQPCHANTFKLLVAESYGRLEARDAVGGKPAGKAYVNVYARLNGRDGAVFQGWLHRPAGTVRLRQRERQRDFGRTAAATAPASLGKE